MENEYFKVNIKRWNERVQINANSKMYNLEAFKKGELSLLPIEVRELGDVSGKTMIHFQSHFGMDTLSWSRKGAIVTGIDFSDKAIARAKQLSEEMAIPSSFIQANIYDLPEIIKKQYDIVFTSYGVLCWLPDLEKWARSIDHCLKPGGIFYIIESHPFGFIIDENFEEGFQAGYPYFSQGKAIRFEDEFTPTDPVKKVTNIVSYEWIHTIGDVINSLIKIGLEFDYLHEFPYSFFPLHPNMKKGADGYYYFENKSFNVPMMFSLKARKPLESSN